MNTDDLKCSEGSVLVERAYSTPRKVMSHLFFKNEYFQDGRIYCCLGDDQDLVVLNEDRLDVIARVDVIGNATTYVNEKQILFQNDAQNATLISRSDLEVEVDNINVPRALVLLSKACEARLLFMYVKSKVSFGLFEFPSMKMLWEHSNSDVITRGQVVFKGGLYAIHKRGIKKSKIADGQLVWEVNCKDWLTHPLLQQRLDKSPTIRTESTGIFADTLVLSLDVSFTVGIDIHTGNIRWVIDAFGPQNLRVTPDGIGWYFREGSIYRLDIAKGELLPPIPVQFSPVLEKPAAAHLGGFDMSTTHIIAEVSMRTSAGYTVGHIVGIRRDNGVCEWAVPIEGTVTKLYLLNNRIYATGTFMGADIKTPSSKTLIIEGEGGYIPD